MKNNNKIELIDKIISKSIKKIKLLEELKESIRYESCEYELVKKGSSNNKFYFLYKLTNKKVELVCSGDFERVSSWLKKRKISFDVVFSKSHWEHIITSED